MTAIAGSFIVLPQHMGLTDQPMLMRLIELEALAVTQEARTADQRNVVEPDDVEAAAVEKIGEFPRMSHRAAELMSKQHRQLAERRFEADHLDPRIGLGWAGLAACESDVRILVVDDGDFMAPIREPCRQPADSDPVSAEIVRRIESRQHGDLQRHAELLACSGEAE